MNRSIELHPFVQLTLMRVREFIREPEAVFWALIFPILLAGGLGVAFRSDSPAPVPVVVTSPELASTLVGDPALDVQLADEARAVEALRGGRALLVIEQAADGTAVFRYDESNPEARAARLTANQAL